MPADVTEEDTAELSKWAAEEASKCLDSDGKVVVRRLRTLFLGAKRHFLRQLLGRFPSTELLSLKERSGDLGVSTEVLEDLLSGDVINSAFLAEHSRARSAWLRRPVPATSGDTTAPGMEAVCAPPPIGANLTGIKVPIFGKAGALMRAVVPRELDRDEKQHPSVETSGGSGGKLRIVPSMGAFRALLSAFTHGLSEHIPWGNGVVLGGSACLACLAIPEDILKKWSEELEQAASLWCGAGASHRALVTALGHGAGCNIVASMITAFAAPRQEARRLLAPLTKQLFGESSPYAGSDLDLFFFAPSKAKGARALEETRNNLASAMTNKGSEPPCTVRTPNSVTLCGSYPLRHTQLICKLAEDISEILAFADMHCTALLYDGCQVWGTPLAIRSLELGYSFISNKQFTATAEVARRAAKYAQRGFGTLIYELCRHTPRCDVEVDDKVRRQLELARRLAQRPLRPLRWVQRESAGVMGVDGYDEVHLPRGSPADVENFVKNQQRLQEDGPAGVSTVKVVTCGGAADWWAPLIEWRRDREPQLRRKFGLESGETTHCYMCGNHVHAAKAKPIGTEGKRPEGVDSQSSGHTTASSSDGAAPAPVQRRVPLCTGCARLNAQRVADREDLSGFTAVVTGGRCKVGYEACLSLLRCGAFVVTCTRFPRCAARRFLKESDAAEWSGRLHIYGVDFSDFPSLQAFASQLARYYAVDVLVNNAAQTIRRPPAYYGELFEEERGAFVSGLGISAAGVAAEGPVRSLGSDPWSADRRPPSITAVRDLAAEDAVALAAQAVDSAPLHSAAQALVPRLPGDAEGLTTFFPSDRLDLHGEPLDLRPRTSWTTSLAAREQAGAIAPRELLEVLAVNAAAPFILLQQLVPVLTRPGGSRGRFVVNVTSAEGVFSGDGASAKSAEHPHSNMAKAALNMLTKTAAMELAGQGVYCTAVDPGWISMMRPGEPTLRGRPLPPLSEADGAARVLAPVLDGVRALRGGREPRHGVLLRNFRPVAW